MNTILDPENLNMEFKIHFNITKIHSTIKGGQKTVFIVTKDNVKVALKLFHNFNKRDIRELDIYKKFEYLDGIPKIISIEEFNGSTVVFEEFIEGWNLYEIADKYASDLFKIKDLIKKICVVLEPIWNDGKIHRDIKPKNIMIRENGDPVVIDFGIALDLSGTVYTNFNQPLSWEFASPEQILNKRELIDYRSDFFSLGLIAYTLYYQKKPFGNSYEEIFEKFNSGDCTYFTETDCNLNTFFKECLGFYPADRPKKIEDLLKIIEC